MAEEDGAMSFLLIGDLGHKVDLPWEGGHVGGVDEIHESQYSSDKGEFTHQEMVSYINSAAQGEYNSSDESVGARKGLNKQ